MLLPAETMWGQVGRTFSSNASALASSSKHVQDAILGGMRLGMGGWWSAWLFQRTLHLRTFCGPECLACGGLAYAAGALRGKSPQSVCHEAQAGANAPQANDFDKVSSAYANALVDLAQEKNALDTVHADVDSLQACALRTLYWPGSPLFVVHALPG